MPYLLHRLLAESAALRPSAEAVRLLDRSLSYGELDAQSNQVAHALIDRGVSKGDRVGLYLQKSPEALVAIFGILKTGACYVPIDANAPKLRVLEIARQCDFRALLSTRSLYGNFEGAFEQQHPSAPVLLVDRSGPTTLPDSTLSLPDILESYPRESPEIEVIDHDLAYILFTSGSTGSPKGVMLSHRNALTFVNWAVDTFAISAEDRLSNHAPFNFDLSVFDIFAAVKAGAAISLVPEGLSVFPLQLSRFIQEQRITVWYSVPMILMFLQARGKLERGDFSSLRWILFAGEVFPTKHLHALMQKLPRAVTRTFMGRRKQMSVLSMR